MTFCLRRNAAAPAALRFFRKVIRHHGEPEVETIDKSGANTAVWSRLTQVNLMKKLSRSGRQIPEKSYRRGCRNVKRLIRPMLRFKLFRSRRY
ncbi:IS6 family transposase [Enterobacter asburiae]|nr:IS6 family transposase [Enterobacter asburiae]